MNAFDQLNMMLGRLGAHSIELVSGNYTDPNHLTFRLVDGSVESITLLGKRISASALKEYFQRRCPEARLNFYAYNFLGGNKQPHLVPIVCEPKTNIINSSNNESRFVYMSYSELVEAIGGR